jgi:ABC-type phosphate transport system permease subunit
MRKAMNEYIAYSVDGITLVSSVGGNSIISGKVSMDMGMGSGSGPDMGMGTEIPMDGGSVKNPLLSSWVFVAGITTVTLAISVGLGILLAKRKIKKGFELYED